MSWKEPDLAAKRVRWRADLALDGRPFESHPNLPQAKAEELARAWVADDDFWQAMPERRDAWVVRVEETVEHHAWAPAKPEGA